MKNLKKIFYLLSLILIADSSVSAQTSIQDGASTRAEDVEYTVMPGNAKVESWSFTCGTYGYKIGVAFKGDYVYVQGLMPEIPKGVIKGKVNDDGTVSFNNRQLVGFLNDYYKIYFILAKNGTETLELESPDSKYVLALDEERKRMTVTDESLGKMILFNYYLDNINFVARIINPTLKAQDDFSGTPANPYDLGFTDDTMSLYGYRAFYANLPTVTAEKNALINSELYYRVFLNEEILTFYDDEYNALPNKAKELEMLPYAYSNSYDIVITPGGGGDPYPVKHYVGIYPEGVETVGIQTVYEHDGVTTMSDIVTLDVLTGEVTTDKSGVGRTDIDGDVTDVRYYDISGRELAEPAKGLCIKSIRYSDGTVRTIKAILR